MLEKIISITLISFISLIPIVIWWYIFSYIDNSRLSRKRFIVWLIWWTISVIPILFLDKILESSKFNFLNIFEKITNTDNIIWLFNFNLSLISFLFILAWFAFIAISWTNKNKQILKIYLKNIIYFSGFILLLSIIIFLLSKSWIWGWEIKNSQNFWELVFNTLKLIIFYYLLVAFIEEASKHFNFLQSSILNIKTIQNWVLYAIFVALWFALIENILYLYSDYKNSWFSMELASTYFYRSIFSIMVHVLCSSIVWYAFSKVYLENWCSKINIKYLKTFFLWLAIAILLHLIFDVSLTLEFSFMIMIYFIWGYLYISSIFYKE